jgi:hypothetical protein
LGVKWEVNKRRGVLPRAFLINVIIKFYFTGHKMTELKILIESYDEELKMRLNERIRIKVLKCVKRCNELWNDNQIEEFDIGYLGMIMECDDGRSVYVYDDFIIYTHDNITQWLSDPDKKINYILLEVAIKKYYDELNYWYESREHRVSERKKKKFRKKRIEDALRMYEE